MLDTSESIDDTGMIKWDLALLLLLAWVIVYFALWKGITNSRVVNHRSHELSSTSLYWLSFSSFTSVPSRLTFYCSFCS